MKATEVQGASKEVGAKVMYQGCEMTVITVKSDDDSDDKRDDESDEGHEATKVTKLILIDLSAVAALADALKANAALTSLKCAAPRQFANCQQPLTLLLTPLYAASTAISSVAKTSTARAPTQLRASLS